MTQRRFHYELAFESLLRRRRVPYIAVDEARRALLPDAARLRVGTDAAARPANLKSFDFVVHQPTRSLLVDVKGRKVARRKNAPLTPGRLESWVTEDDLRSLRTWRDLFAPPHPHGAPSHPHDHPPAPRHRYTALFVFLYWCHAQPPDGLFQEVFEHSNRWYAVRAIELDAYRHAMTQRSARWRTVHLPTADFERLSEPFADWVTPRPTPRYTPGPAPDPAPGPPTNADTPRPPRPAPV
jgi:hypothetical protein